MTLANDAATRPSPCPRRLRACRGSHRWLSPQEQAAANQNQIATRELPAEHAQERLGQADDPADPEQQHDSHAHRGDRRVGARRCSRQLPDRIEMKMMLSTPRTISRTVSVVRATAISAISFQRPAKRRRSSGSHFRPSSLGGAIIDHRRRGHHRGTGQIPSPRRPCDSAVPAERRDRALTGPTRPRPGRNRPTPGLANHRAGRSEHLRDRLAAEPLVGALDLTAHAARSWKHLELRAAALRPCARAPRMTTAACSRSS